MRTKRRISGFQLIDLMVAVALLVVVMTMGIERLDRATELARLQSAGEILLSELTRARKLALSHNIKIGFELRGTRAGYAMSSGGEPLIWKALPPGVQLSRIPGRAIQFHSRGTAAPAGSIEVENSAGRIRIVVNPAGRIRKEEEFVD